MNNLNQKTEEFIATIKETKEFQNFKKASEIYEKDENAQKLLKDFQMAQQKLAILQEGSFSGQQNQKEKVDSLRKEVGKNEVIKNWIDAQRKFQGLVGGLASAISSSLKFPFVPSKKRVSCCG